MGGKSMSISARWDNEERTVIRMIYHRTQWEWDDFHNALGQTQELLNDGDGPIFFLIDMANARLGPSVLISHARILHQLKRNPRVKVVIVVGADPFTQALYLSANSAMKPEDLFHFSRTLDDAYDEIVRSQEPAVKQGKWEYWQFVLGL